jgi:hypothetical protein
MNVCFDARALPPPGVIAMRIINSGDEGVSGRLVFSSGTSKTGNSGATVRCRDRRALWYGDHQGIGSGTSGSGGALSVLSGRSTVTTSGALMVESGEVATTSGVIVHRMMIVQHPRHATICCLSRTVQSPCCARKQMALSLSRRGGF